MIQQKLFKVKEKPIEEMTYKELRKKRHEETCRRVSEKINDSIRKD